MDAAGAGAIFRGAMRWQKERWATEAAGVNHQRHNFRAIFNQAITDTDGSRRETSLKSTGQLAEIFCG